MRCTSRRRVVADLGPEPGSGFDPELDQVLKKILQIIYRDHPLSPNQILILSSELQRLGVHRLVQEHLRKYQQRRDSV